MISAPISEQQLSAWKDEFYKCPKNIVAQNVCTKMDPFDACMSRRSLESINHVFQTQVKNTKKPVTNQKSSGRCWLFAALNTIRVRFGNDSMDELEFSQSHLFFWDKIERCNYFLHNVVNTAKRGEKVDGRLVAFLLNDPICDGGQWDMLVNLIQKHGLMPKQCFPESFSSESSMRMNAIIKSKLREYTKVLRDMIMDGASDEKLQDKIKEQMSEIYKVVGICLGIPPDTFTWEYYDKSKNHHQIGPITPKNFYENHVKPSFNIEDKYVFVTDPRPTNPFNFTYTVDCLGNVVGGRPVLYNNQAPELLMTMVQNSITDGEPVWFGCEVSKRFASKQGIEDLDVHDFKSMFNVDIQKTLTKADRLLYGESAMTHAMVFTGFSKSEVSFIKPYS
ncbi:BLMH family protein [Megaselia abdita]